MKFRPCIDIHEGIVKQIVGSTLTESNNDKLVENFVSTKSTSDYAKLYQDNHLYGGHIIMLGPNCEQATIEALQAFPNGFHVGGGINNENAKKYLEAGASHVIVTSYVFIDGKIDFNRLIELSQLIDKDRLVLDLSCRKKPNDINGYYYVVTNKWTKYTDFALTYDNLSLLSQYCSEFLVHGVDVEGKRCGIEIELVKLLGEYSTIPVTYAGGIRSIDDLELVNQIGNGKVDCTIGSSLDIFGGDLSFNDVVQWHNNRLLNHS